MLRADRSAVFEAPVRGAPRSGEQITFETDDPATPQVTIQVVPSQLPE